MNNFDVEYHESADKIESKTPAGSWLIKNGRVEFVPWTKIPSTFLYSSQKKNIYVPSYIESVLYRKIEKIQEKEEEDLLLFSKAKR